jgi:hypothetical protein
MIIRIFKTKSIVMCLFLILLGKVAIGQTFICKDWEGRGMGANENGVFEGTMMIGEKNGNTIKIRNSYKDNVILNYIGKYNDTGVSLYQSLSSNNHISIYAIHESSLYKAVTLYDFEITHLSVASRYSSETQCSYQ